MAQTTLQALSSVPTESEDDLFLTVAGGLGYKTTRSELRTSLVGYADGYAISDTAITLATTDKGCLIETTSNSAVTITIPAEADTDLGEGFTVYGVHHGTSTLTFAGTVTILFDSGYTEVVEGSIYAPWTLIKSRVAADTWVLYGKLVAV